MNRLITFLGPQSGHPVMSGLICGCLYIGLILLAMGVGLNISNAMNAPRGHEVVIVTRDAKGQLEVSRRFPNCRTETLKDGSTLIYGKGVEVVTDQEVVTKIQ